MRNLNLLDIYRRRDRQVIKQFGNTGDGTCGVFDVKSNIDKANMLVIASSGMNWDHISVSRKNRCPNWPEMEQVKRLFFKDDETVMQLHLAVDDHINYHPNCLHLWRPHNQDIPSPPHNMVGPKDDGK